MADPDGEPEDDAREAEAMDELASPSESPGRSPDQNLFFVFSILLTVVLAGVLWLALSSSTPPKLRGSMDMLLQLAFGGTLAYGGFRMLLVFPFRFPDLLAIVIVLSLGLKAQVDVLEVLNSHGITSDFMGDDQRKLSITLQVCMITASILLIGAALGLRHCHLLKIEKPLPRLLAIVSGMLVLPAVAGVFSFPVFLLRDAMTEKVVTDDTPALLLLWLASIICTVVNASHAIRTLSLKEEINAREKMP
jgi:hypothetical protein